MRILERRAPYVLALALAGVSIAVVAGLLGQAQPFPPNPAAIPGGTLTPDLVPKYVLPLVIPPVMPLTSMIKPKGGMQIDYYEIAVRQFAQQILPPSLPTTTVWGYGSVTTPGTFNYPSFTIEAKAKRPVRVKWVNGLVDALGNFLPPIVPVDQTIHWANPPGGTADRDSVGTVGTPYAGPVPIITHVHGAHVEEDSDGYPEAWYLPVANNIPAGYAKAGSFYDANKALFQARTGVVWEPGSATFQYPNDGRAQTVWYHDHALGMTRTNVYSGMAGFYLVRGGPADLNLGYRPPKLGDKAGLAKNYTEIPIAIQDKSFNDDGALFFPASREFFDGFTGPYAPDPASDISPIFNPEFFGNMMVVNGRTWPSLDVQARRYRFRFLNGCNARMLILRLATDNTPLDGTIDDGDWTALPGVFWVIGTEGGFLPAPVQLDELALGQAERNDTIIDFAAYQGQTLYLVNVGPDEPFGGGAPGIDFAASHPASTGQVMRFVVTAPLSLDATTPPNLLTLPALTPLGAPSVTRQVSLNELDSALLPGIGPLKALLGLVDLTSVPGTPQGMPMMWDDAVTESPALNATEVWEIYNFTEDAHPIHLHLVQFEVVNREVFNPLLPGFGVVRPPEAWEAGLKDTVLAFPGEITRIKAKFDLAGLYVWHCHIIDHEDHEMMRPYRVQ